MHDFYPETVLNTQQQTSNVGQLPRCSYFFFKASHLGTAVASARTHTHATHYTRTPHSHFMHTSRPTTTHRYETASFWRLPELHGSIDDGRITISLWVHAWEATYFYFWGHAPVRHERRALRLERSQAGSYQPLPTTGLSARSLFVLICCRVKYISGP